VSKNNGIRYLINSIINLPIIITRIIRILEIWTKKNPDRDFSRPDLYFLMVYFNALTSEVRLSFITLIYSFPSAISLSVRPSRGLKVSVLAPISLAMA